MTLGEVTLGWTVGLTTRCDLIITPHPYQRVERDFPLSDKTENCCRWRIR